MPDRPHSRKVKIAEGTAQVKKGEKISAQEHASERETPGAQNGQKAETREK